jgi:hypothetical protein
MSKSHKLTSHQWGLGVEGSVVLQQSKPVKVVDKFIDEIMVAENAPCFS